MNIKNKQHKDIPGYEGKYAITIDGMVWSYRSKKFLRPSKNPCGYLVVHLSNNGKEHMPRIHRLIAQAFLPNPFHYPVINHKDHNRMNNKLDNLEWCTVRQNAWDSFLYPKNQSYRRYIWGKRPNRRMRFMSISTDGKAEYFEGLTETAKKFHMCRNKISACIQGKRKEYRGYKWMLVE